MIGQALHNAWEVISKTEGVGNPFQQFETLTWILALRLSVAAEAEDRTMLELSGESFKSAFEDELEPSVWLARGRGHTGNDLIVFLRDQFFPKMKELQSKSRVAPILRAIFSQARLYPQSGYRLREAIDHIFGLDLSSSASRDELKKEFEKLINEYAMKLPKPMRFYTPRPLVRTIIQMLEIQPHERVYDPAFGTGGFLGEAFNVQLAKAGSNTNAIEKIHEQNINGNEKDPLQFLIGLTLFLVHQLLTPKIGRTNTLSLDVRQLGEDQKYDVVVCNPTFDSEEDTRAVTSNFPIITESVELLFLQHLERSTKNPGRGAILLPEGVLFNSSNAHQQVRKDLLNRVNLHTIVSLPAVGVKTSLLMYSRPGPTRNIWMYSLRVNDGTELTPKNGLQDHHFEELLQRFKARPDLPNARTVAIEELSSDHNLSVSNYIADAHDEEILLEPEAYIEKIDHLLDQAKTSVAELKQSLETT